MSGLQRSRAFNIIVNLVLTFEGGYVNDPRDNGGETKYGIAAKFNPGVDIKNLTVEGAKDIYYKKYWQTIPGIENLDRSLQLVAFDTSVNMGVGVAIEMLKDSNYDWEEMIALRLERYTKIPDWVHYSRGWTRRIAHLTRLANQFETTSSEVVLYSPLGKGNTVIGSGTLINKKVYVAEFDLKAYQNSGGKK